jgi:Toxic anion resistance protein (TelA)
MNQGGINVTPDPKQTPLTPPEPPLQLALPEPVAPVKSADTASALVPMKEETRSAVAAQADHFIADLLQMDVASGEFRARVDSAFRLGRKEIGDSALLTGKFMEQNFVKDADNPAFRVMNEMRGLFESLDPGKEGDLFSPHKILGVIPYGNRLQAYLQRFDSASGSLRKLIDNIYGVQDELARDDKELFATMNKLLDAMVKLKSVDLFIERLDATLTQAIAKLRATELLRAKAIEQEVLFYARQASMDVKTQMLVCINGYKMLEGLRKTGRELHNGCDRMATIGMSSLSIAVTLARAQGYQMKVMDALRQGSTAIEGLLASTAKMFGDHVDRVVEFQANPLIGVQTLKASFDTVFAGLDKLDEFRTKSIESMGANIALLKGLLAEGEARMQREHTAVQAISQVTGSAPSGPVTL